jgi:homoserine kinase
LAYESYCAVLASLSEEVRGVKIHIDSNIPICRGLGSSAALLVAGAMGANVLRGNRLSTQGLLNITNAMEGHPDNLAPAFYGGLTASMVDNGLPVCVNFPLHPDWQFLALVPDFNLPTTKARAVLPEQVSRADAIYNIAHGALVLKALELGDEKLLRTAMQDRLHQNYRKKMITDYEKIEALVRTTGAAFCLSGAGPTLLCITQDDQLQEKLAKKLGQITTANWQMLPLHIEFQGARVIDRE